MSIANKIKELQKIQAKIELYERLAANISEDCAGPHKESEDSELYIEFGKEVLTWAKQRMSQLNGESPQKFKPLNEEVRVLKKEVPDIPKQEDPLTFALKWKRNEGKRVVFTTKDGVIEGSIKGVNPPNIVVETITGLTITIPPNELTIKEEN